MTAVRAAGDRKCDQVARCTGTRTNELLADVDLTSVEVDVIEFQTEDLATPETAGGGEVDDRGNAGW